MTVKKYITVRNKKNLKIFPKSHNLIDSAPKFSFYSPYSFAH